MFHLTDLKHLETLVIDLSNKVLLPFLEKTHANIKSDGSIVTEADLAMQNAIETALKENFGHNIAVLGEECPPQKQADIIKNNKQFWVFDPLDGTTNFHAAFPVFCISLAFIDHNGIQLGITYDPIRQECFSALKGHGFFYNLVKTRINPHKVPTQIKDCIAFIDFKRLNKKQSIDVIRQMPFKSQRNIGSSALEWAWLAMNRANVSYHGGQKLWDYAAGSLLLSEAGGYSQDRQGSQLYQHSIDVRPVVAGTSKELCQLWHNTITT